MSTPPRSKKLNRSQLVNAFFSRDDLFEIEPTAIPWNGQGRPRKYPACIAAIYGILSTIYGSFSMTDAELRDPVIWGQIRALWEAKWPTLPAALRKLLPRTLPVEPYQKFHYDYAADRYLVGDAVNEKLGKFSARIAREFGAFDGDWDSLTKPDPRNTITADTTTMKPLARKGTKREDPDARDWIHGGHPDDDNPSPSGITVHNGVEHLIISYNKKGEAMLTLSTRPVGEPGQEVNVLKQMLDDLMSVIEEVEPDAEVRALIYDKAVRGEAIDEIQRKHGFMVGTTKSKGTDASPTLKSTPFEEWDGHIIRLEEGRPIAYELTVDGELRRSREQPKRLQVKRKQIASGEYRFNVGYRFKGKVHWLRAWNHSDDHYSRCENLRLLDNETLAETGIGGYRNNSENLNRQAKRDLPDGRARSKGANRQRLDLMWEGYKNGFIALVRHQMALGPPDTAKAA